MPDYSVGVCGFGRCGSTMLMGMLAAGGLPPVAGAKHPPHEVDASRLTAAQLTGRCVKVLAFGHDFSPPPAAAAWRFVWLDRDPTEQAKSTIKLLVAAGEVNAADLRADAVEQLAAGYSRDRAQYLGVIRRHGPVLTVTYERALSNPRRLARQLRAQIWPGLDVNAASAVVHRRDWRCLPDLAAEYTAITARQEATTDAG